MAKSYVFRKKQTKGQENGQETIPFSAIDWPVLDYSLGGLRLRWGRKNSPSDGMNIIAITKQLKRVQSRLKSVSE